MGNAEGMHKQRAHAAPTHFFPHERCRSQAPAASAGASRARARKAATSPDALSQAARSPDTLVASVLGGACALPFAATEELEGSGGGRGGKAGSGSAGAGSAWAPCGAGGACGGSGGRERDREPSGGERGGER